MAIIDSVSIGNETRDIYDSGAARKVTSATNGHLAGLDSNGNLTDSGVASDNVMKGKTIYIRNNGDVSAKYYKIYEYTGSNTNFVQDMTISGEIGRMTNPTRFDVLVNFSNPTPWIQGYCVRKIDTLGDLFFTYEGSGNSRTVRVYFVYDPSGGETTYTILHAQITTTNIGTVYINPTAENSYEGTIDAKLSSLAMLPTLRMKQTVTTSTTAETSCTFTSIRIKADSDVDVKVGVDGLDYKSITLSNGSATVTFYPQETAQTVNVVLYVRWNRNEGGLYTCTKHHLQNESFKSLANRIYASTVDILDGGIWVTDHEVIFDVVVKLKTGISIPANGSKSLFGFENAGTETLFPLPSKITNIDPVVSGTVAIKRPDNTRQGDFCELQTYYNNSNWYFIVFNNKSTAVEAGSIIHINLMYHI